jgi:hypothetical protein
VLAGPDRITLAGGSGSGYVAKLLASLLWSGQAIATSCGSRSRQRVASPRFCRVRSRLPAGRGREVRSGTVDEGAGDVGEPLVGAPGLLTQQREGLVRVQADPLGEGRRARP